MRYLDIVLCSYLVVFLFYYVDSPLTMADGCSSCSILYIAICIFVAYKLLKLYMDSIKGVCTSQRTLEGKTVIVTGGSAGLYIC